MSEACEQWQCSHQEFECRFRQLLGRQEATPVLQCLRCGSQIRAVRNSDACVFEAKKRKLNGDPGVMFDEALHRKWLASRMNAYENNRDTENREWWARYNAHLDTTEWKRRRDQVIKRDHGVCQGCLQRQATQAHHLTYATYNRIGTELLFELVAICDECHRLLHPHLPEVVEVKLGRH